MKKPENTAIGMNWKEHLKTHTCTADEAIKSIRDNDHVVYSQAAATPFTINEALAKHARNYRNVSICHMLFPGNPVHLAPETEGHLWFWFSFIDAVGRKALAENRGDYCPAYFHQYPQFFNDKTWLCDVAVMQVTPPDENGYCSFGVSCDYIKAASDNARITIAEMNDQAPYFCNKENLIHVSRFRHIVRVSRPLPEIKKTVAGEVEAAIARNCTSLIGDGATIQVGIGAIPDTVLASLADRKDLGVHTELFTPGLVDLIKAGVITGKRKTFHPEKALFTFLMGDKSTYDFVNNNPMLEAHPVDYTNNIGNIAKNDNMISVNSCIEVDLAGQVAAESIGTRMYSGTGGQVDYVKGAQLSKGGKSVIALSSTAAKGAVSRIVPFLQQGATVTTSRNDVDYIATEYGIVRLRGKSLRERAKLLINIAHPKFREELDRHYFDMYKQSALDLLLT